MNRQLSIGAVMGVLLLIAVVAGVSVADSDETKSLEELAATASQQYEEAKAAERFASSPVAPVALGCGLGLGVGLIGGALFAYRNRGLR